MSIGTSESASRGRERVRGGALVVAPPPLHAVEPALRATSSCSSGRLRPAGSRHTLHSGAIAKKNGVFARNHRTQVRDGDLYGQSLPDPLRRRGESLKTM